MTTTIGDRVEEAVREDGLALVTTDGRSMSWAEVFDEYSPALTAFARSRGAREPEDIVQDVFVAAVEQLPRFTGDRSGLRSLLFTITYRRIADDHRRSHRRPEHLVAEHRATPAPEPTIEQVIARDESTSTAIQAFSLLTERERQVIQMRILEDASPARVAQTLGLSAGNVRVIQARALAKLRAHLKSIGETGSGHAVIAGGTLTRFLRNLGRSPSPGDPLRPWIEELRAAFRRPTLEQTGAANIATLTPGRVSRIDQMADLAGSLFTTVVTSGAVRIGAIASVLALSALPVVGGGDGVPLDRPQPVAEVDEPSARPEPTPGGASLDVAERRIDSPGEDATDLPSPAVPESPPTPVSRFVPDDEAPPRAETGPVEAEEATRPVVVDQVVEPLVDDPAAPVVEEVVEVIQVVEDTTRSLVEDVMEPIVEETVDVVAEATPGLVDEIVEPLVEGATGTLESAIPEVGALLGR